MNQEKDPFVYQKPTDESTERIIEVRQECQKMRDLLVRVIPASRELSLAITKLEEVSMWANKGIVFNQTIVGSSDATGA